MVLASGGSPDNCNYILKFEELAIAESEKGPTTVNVATSTNFHVLIAHGNARLRMSYSDALSHRGFLVTTANDGLTCLALLRGITPDVLMLEQELLWGGADGVLAMLHDDLALPRMPVAIIVANPDRVKRRLTRSPNMRCFDNLLPPDRLARKIQQLMGNRAPREDRAVLVS